VAPVESGSDQVNSRRRRAIVVAGMLVPLAVVLALWALLSQLTFFGEQPAHQGRAALLLVVSVVLVVGAFAVLARNGAGLGRVRRSVEAAVAAVAGGWLASLPALPVVDRYTVPVVFGIGCGAAVALPRLTPVRLVARLTAVAAMLALVGWLARANPERSIAWSVLLVLPSVVAGDAVASRWKKLRSG
jgi:hypothetical protein